MRTSALRHPKHEHAITIHSWMMKITNNNLYAATLLAYLENKFNIMLDMKEKSGGWMKLQRFQVKNGMFATTFNEVDDAINLLESLDLILVNHISDHTGEALKSGEISIKLDALRINEWLDVYCKKVDNKMDLLEYAPFMNLLLIGYKLAEVQIEDEQPELFELKQVETKKRKTKDSEPDSTYIGKARNLFTFWKTKTGHKRSNLGNKFANMIIARIKDGYTDGQIAHGIIGLTFSKYHIENKYDHIEYVVRDTAKLDRMIAIAIKNNVTEDMAFQEFLKMVVKIENGEELSYDKKIFVNPTTGKELV